MSLMKKQISKIRENQSGLASIVVTAILMILIGIIVIGFVRLVQRDQRQALDRQLSTQAFYAAETGVNDAIKAIQAGYNQEKTSCQDPSDPIYSPPYNVNTDIDSDSGTQVTCLLIDPFVDELEYDNVGTDISTVVPITLRDPAATIRDLAIMWWPKSGSGSPNCPGAGAYPELPPQAQWTCQAGIMRMDVTPFSGGQSRTSLSSNTMTRFMYPSLGGSNTIGYGANTQPDTTQTRCSVFGTCTMTIQNINSRVIYLRLKSIYRASKVRITCTANPPATSCEMGGTQIKIDSTAKANDVLRRVQVRMPANGTNDMTPDGPITTGDHMCKRYVIKNGSDLDDPTPCGGFTP